MKKIVFLVNFDGEIGNFSQKSTFRKIKTVFKFYETRKKRMLLL